MQPIASRKGPSIHSACALALTASVLAFGCSGGTETQSKPAVSAPPASASGVPQGAQKAVASAPKVAETPAAAAPAAPHTPAPAATAPSATPASTAEKIAAAEAAKANAQASKPAPAPFASAANASGAGSAAEAKAALAKAQAAAGKIADPLSLEADPNSKAKLTYEFGTDSKNFNKCMQGDVLTHTFQLQSSGEEDLVIKQAKPTCGCTVAQVATQQADGTMAPYNFGAPIPPGRKVEITATLHTQNKRGHAASRINIFSNDPRGQSQLGLEADVDPFFQVNPQSLNFNTLSARDTANDKVTIATTRGEKVKLTAGFENMPGVPQGMKVELNPADPDAEGKATRWELVATLGPGLVEGNLNYNATLKSDIAIPGGEKLPSGNAPTYEVSVPIMARVTGMISYAPAFVSLGLIRPGQVVSRSVKVTSHDPEFKMGEHEPKVLVQGHDGAEWDLASRFSVVIRPVTGENSIDIELRLDGMPDTLNGSFNGTLVIQVGHPEKPEIKLPITGVCRGGPVPTVPTSGQAPPTPPK
jgi:hypothetical protein